MDRQEFKFLLNYLENNREHLNTLQHKFIVSLKDNYNATGVLTKKQVEFLYDTNEYIRSQVLEMSVHESESDRYAAQYSSFDHFTQYKI
jgi:hypothetical protein